MINFMGQWRYAVSLSALVVVLSIAGVAFRGLNFGLDFTGGTLVELRFDQPVQATSVRTALIVNGQDDAVVQNIGSERDIMVRVPAAAGLAARDQSEAVARSLVESFPSVEVRRTEYVGPVVGDELRDQGGLAVIAAFFGIFVYVMWRFTTKFAVGALIALVHDVIITVGAFAWFRWTVDLSTVAALLTVIGYSINDTIVICDRIRENLRRFRKTDVVEVINVSLNQTLERTLIMSGTMLMVLVGMIAFGGEQLFGMSVALTIGVVVGTWSSVYVAAAYLIHAGLTRADLVLAETDNLDEAA
jgi:preprotein translocase subunit SecF